MADRYGSDFITIEDEDGTEFELEVLVTVEYNGCSYLAVIPAVGSDEEMDVVGNLCIIKNVIEGDDEEGTSVFYNLNFDYSFSPVSMASSVSIST